MSSINNEQNIFQVSSPPPFNTMGLFTYLRTYARRHDETDPKSTVETWRECIQRVVESCNNQLHVNFTKEEMKEVFNLLYNLKCSVAGRFLWQLGTRTVDNLGLPSLQNCSFVTINEPVRPFTWAMNFLMLGSGVGYRVLPEDLKDFPNVKHVVVTRKDTKDADFIVPDSREGWIKLLGKVLKAHFYSGKSFTYSCTLLRSKGAPIKSFGGLASGPEVLCDGIEKINIVLNKRAGQSLRPIDALDVMNIIGMIVVSGNVRRSAQICLGDSKDAEYLNAKNWASGTIPNWRAFSNNSVICNDINEILENKQFWEGYNGTGEPYGLINLNLSKSCGRLGETQYNDPHVEGYNPCLTGDTLILTKDGMKRIDELVGKQFIAIVNGQEHSSTEQGFWKTGRRQVCKMTLKNGNTIRATLNHKFASCGYVAEDPLFYIWNELSDFELNEDVIVCDDHGYFGKSQIISITLDCEEDVYDCTINDVHCFSANGILSHNCAEQSLSNYETCCLGELYLPNITTKEELYKCATYIYRICKHSLTLPCKESEETERIVHKNMRMGIGVTGYLQATDEQRGWLSDCYKYLREFDKQYSIERGFPTSIKLTTCKPSGCSRGDMLVQTDKGLLRLDEIGNTKGDEWQKIENLQVPTDTGRYELVNKFYINGNVQTRKILTEDGNEIESSLNHRYRVVEDGKYIWKTVEELKVGDKLVVCLGGHPEKIETKLNTIELEHNTNCQVMKQPEKLTRDIAWFLGLFYGDGSVHKAGIRISFNRKQPSLLQWLTSFVKDTFNLQSHIDDDHSFYVNSQQLKKWLEFQGCLKDYSTDLCLPKIIRTSSRDIAVAFIDGFWRADGGIHTSNNSWSVCTVSEKFAKELFVLCRSVGYNIKLSCAGPGGLGSRDRWIISFRRMDDDKMRYLSKKLKSRFYGNYWLDPIVSLEDSSCDTYDIEVENAHHYRLGGTVSHNTLSLLGGCTSGVHPGFARYYKRRIRIASESPLIKVAKDHGYPVEFVKNFDGSLDHSTQIITFPYSLPENTVLAENCTAIQQLEWVKKLQTEWSDNSVSVTVYYRKNELGDIKEWLRNNYNNSIKSVSFLLHSDHGFQQAPLEQISKEEFLELDSKCRAITDLTGICFTDESDELINQGECVGGACPMR
jgi:intein/homing endonuclease